MKIQLSLTLINEARPCLHYISLVFVPVNQMSHWTSQMSHANANLTTLSTHKTKSITKPLQPLIGCNWAYWALPFDLSFYADRGCSFYVSSKSWVWRSGFLLAGNFLAEKELLFSPDSSSNCSCSTNYESHNSRKVPALAVMMRF